MRRLASEPAVDRPQRVRIADPAAALADVRRSHAWVTSELERIADAGDIRRKTLTDERMRLAHIAAELHRLLGASR